MREPAAIRFSTPEPVLTQSGLPQNVYAFLLEHLDSLEQLEVMLLLRNERRDWSGPEVAKELRIQPESALNRMVKLAQQGVVAETGGGRYHYAPRTQDMDRDVAGVAAAYSERRVTVINLIATKNLERIRTFADAFKFKGGDK